MKPTIFALLACLPLAAAAQSDTSFTYQGELTVDGAPASGEFDFQACVYAIATGPVIACSADIEDLPVAAGRFTVALDFGAVFDGSPRLLEMRVRQGNETTPHVPLFPRQPLRATPSAQFAARVPFAGIAGLPASLLDGDNVGVTQVTAGAGLSGGTITSSGTLAIAPGGVSAAMLAPNSVGSAQIDPAQVQARISGTCAHGEYFRGFSATGVPQCALLPVSFQRIVESSQEYGRYVAVALRDDGRPVLAYHESGAGSLRLYNCADPVCSTGTARFLATAGDPGEGIAMVLRADGRPLVAYFENTADTLHVYSCNDANCTSGTATPVETALLGALDMALRADGRAVLLYRATGSGLLRSWHCADVDCTAGTGIEHAIPPTGVAIAIRPDGRPLLAGGGNGGAATSPRFWDCADAACTSGTSRSTSGADFQQVDAIGLRPDGRALLLTHAVSSTVSVVACGDVNCTTAPGVPIPVCEAARAVDLAIRPDGTAVVACAAGVGDDVELLLYDCSTANCSSGSVRQLLPPRRAGSYLSLAVRQDDRPIVAFHEAANEDVGLYVCATPECP